MQNVTFFLLFECYEVTDNGNVSKDVTEVFFVFTGLKEVKMLYC